MQTLRHLCTRFQARAEAQGMKGKRRDDAAINYFCGAIEALRGDHKDRQRLLTWVALALSLQGYRAVEEVIAKEGKTKA